jgi:hypothetical protein
VRAIVGNTTLIDKEERRDENRRQLSQEEVDIIAGQILEKIYADIGKSVVKKILWLAGAIVVAVYAALTSIGKIKIGS